MDDRPIYAIRTREGLAPEFRSDLDAFERYPIGARVRVKITQPRSVPKHRLYWQVLSKWVEATDAAYSPETLHEAIKLKLGYVTPIKMADGVHEVPASISFSAMGEAEFSQFMDKAMALLAEAGGFDPLEFYEKETA